MRKTLTLLLVVVVIVGAAAIYFVSNADRLVKSIIESTGSEVVGTAVRVGSVELSLSERRVVIRELRMSNPPGFSNEPALSIGEISAQLDSADYEVIRKVYAGDIAVRVESRGLETNYKQLQENINRYSGAQGTGAGSENERVVLTIDLIELERAEAVLMSDVLAEPLGFGLNRFQLTDLSGTPPRLTRQILSQIVSRVVSAAALKVLEAQARDNAGDAGAAVEELLDQLRGEESRNENSGNGDSGQ